MKSLLRLCSASVRMLTSPGRHGRGDRITLPRTHRPGQLNLTHGAPRRVLSLIHLDTHEHTDDTRDGMSRMHMYDRPPSIHPFRPIMAVTFMERTAPAARSAPSACSAANASALSNIARATWSRARTAHAPRPTGRRRRMTDRRAAATSTQPPGFTTAIWVLTRMLYCASRPGFSYSVNVRSTPGRKMRQWVDPPK